MGEFEPVTLFVRGDEDSSDEDAWDDTILVEQYDRSVNQLKNKVAKLMGDNHGEATTSGKDSSKGRTKRHKKKSINSWEVGSFCRARYSADEVDYEATILSINEQRGTCRVKYLGYGNQEEVYLNTLLPSEGRLARQAQEEQAYAENIPEVDDTEDTEGMIHSDSNSLRQDHKKSRKKFEVPSSDHKHSKWQKNKIPAVSRPLSSANMHFDEGRQFEWPSHIPDTGSLPPPPPPPPHIFEHLPSDDGEALSAMLMSWYMSGYHTGYYYGLKQAKSPQKVHHSEHHRGRWRKT